MQAIIVPAVEELCAAFERGGYNPTPVIDLGVLVASAEGSVGVPERALLSEVFQALLQTALSPEVVDALISASVEVTKAAGAGPRARLVAAILQDCDAVEAGLRVALAVAFASEGLSSAERAVIDRIADLTDVPRSRVDELCEEVKKLAGDDGPASARQSLLPQQKRA